MNSELSKRQTGAALLAVLIVSVILTLLLTATHNITKKRLELAFEMSEVLSDKAAVHAKLQELVFIAATGEKIRAGIKHELLQKQYLRVDGYKYSDIIYDRQLDYSIQAVNGLVPINDASQLWLSFYLEKLGINKLEIQGLLDSLADYADEDDFIRASGSERSAYRKKRSLMPLPPNFLLQDAEEVWNIPKWDTIKVLHPNIPRDFSLSRGAKININAVPIRLLKSLWPSYSSQIETMREKGIWINNSSDLYSVIPFFISVDENYYTYFFDREVILKSETERVREQVRLRLGSKLLPPFVKYK